MIIEWQPGSQMATTSSRGCLINLDRARIGENIQDILVPKVEHPGWDMNAVELRHIADRIADIVITKLADVPEFQIRQDIVLRVFEVPQNSKPHNYSADAIIHALKFGYLPEDGYLSCKTLNWEQVRPCVIYIADAH